MMAISLLSRRVRDALGWRLRGILGSELVDRNIVRFARYWRPLLKNPVFIGVTGSAGKTTTKELLLGVLSHGGPGVGTPATQNLLPDVAKTILGVRRNHCFCVVELSESLPGEMDEPLALLRPDVGIVTVVENDHLAAYDSIAGLGAEMGKLVARLPASGTAVLNADDELVMAMAARCAARVITYGLSPQAELRAEDVSSVWPERLQMTLVRGTERVSVRTQLCGAHWVPSVLGAVGCGLATDMTLAECAKGLESIPPFDGRMQPVETADGVNFIRDDFKAPLWTVDACFKFMKEARATRKIIVVGTLSDYGTGTGASKKYAEVAQRAQQLADFTVFVGPWASSVLKTRQPGRKDALRAFSQVRDAAEYVNSIARAGDLVLLKGTNKQDHLLRIILARNGDVSCWRDDCKRHRMCNACPERAKPSGLAALQPATTAVDAASPLPQPRLRPIDANEQVIVGLGNAETRYAGAPHNVGYEVVDRLAASLRLAWEEIPEAWIARGSCSGRSTCLVKIRLAMNHTGTGLKRLSEIMGFHAEQCILVFDDLDLPLGAVKTRNKGGAGGHRGVASILEAFQTDAIRRVKVGVGHVAARADRVKYVLTAFDDESRATIDRSILTAEAHVLTLLAARNNEP